MKKYLASCLMLGALMVLTGMPLQLLQIDSVKSADAFSGRKHGGQSYILGNAKHSNKTTNDGTDNDDGSNTSVPEPATLALIGSGIAGIGIYGYLRRKNRK
jgi:hypothetical protein